MLKTSTGPLNTVHDLAMLDLDGVIYVGPDAVPGAAGHVQAARTGEMHLAFVTNNASRPPARVAEHLGRLGIPVAAEDVVTSAQAAARLLVDQHGRGAVIFCLGSEGLELALRGEGLVPVTGVDEGAVAVATGFAPEVPWKQVMVAAMLIRDGLPWVASNTDHTVPLPRGTGPGHGVQVRMLSDFSGVDPQVAGKPRRPLLDETVRRVGGRRPLMVGDRLDTDIEGARAAGIDSLLVLTGVTGLQELANAPEHQRPTYVSEDLGGLLVTHHAPQQVENGVRLGGWIGSVKEGQLVVSGNGAAGDWWRVVAATAWAWRDRVGEPLGLDSLEPRVPDAPGTQGTVAT